ncbi:MAG TPA: ATP-binding protein [Chitinophagales bacterium]|nr:ATP-binding protein [Chitinophagales bacterium]
MIIERSFLFLLLLIAVSSVAAQGQRTIDSLENKDTTLSKPQIFQLLLQSLRKNNKGENGSDESQDLKNFSEANELLGNYEEALKYRQMYDEVKDSLSEAERNSQLAELKVHQGNVERIFLILGIALLLILSGITYSRFVVKKQSNRKLEQAYHELRDTQEQLVQQEKLASLGQLTAGIAHEIKNPLNFVNNFSESSEEILDELRVASSAEERNQLIGELKKNLEKISHHGKRADSIVTNMLNHSRTSSGEKQLTDINELCDEFFVLAYHGMKANHPDFNCKLEKNFSPGVLQAEVVVQDVSRVLLNLFNNAFYAVRQKTTHSTPQTLGDSHNTNSRDLIGIHDGNYQPTVSVITQSLPTQSGNSITISVRDNGNGIPNALKERIFEPFFTTKPSGQGTGLGLSISYDIIKAHGGVMKVESKENEFTEFIFTLPA